MGIFSDAKIKQINQYKQFLHHKWQNIKCYDNNRYWKWLISIIVITNKISSEMEIISYNKIILLKIHILC